uniref:Cytochrome c oxidase subunit 2 n=1 Tax=Tropidomya abbreviata TaxID=102404 RepID=A0A1U9XPK0_9BIVA|nr:cytochrome c oxidase subunit II [Tropidomya abbreviata]AQZ26176.1 cytochrome c oxidase subunit II [Tropidomya abbreviata]
MSRSGQLLFIDPVSIVMAKLVDFHDATLFLVLMVCLLVLGVIFSALCGSPHFRSISESQVLEVLWTTIPMFFLVFLAVPSFMNLYFMEDSEDPFVMIKVTGHQWYWSYGYNLSWFTLTKAGDVMPDIYDRLVSGQELSSVSKMDIVPLSKPGRSSGTVAYSVTLNDYVILPWDGVVEKEESIEFGFDSYIKSEDELLVGDYRLLEVDSRMVVPVNKVVNLAVSSADVLHCWTVYGTGLKVDAVPGRVNLMTFVGLRTGIYYGQCSELCGINHSFMPIVMEVVPKDSFMSWLVSVYNKSAE